MTKQYQAVILRIERALPVGGWPLASYKEVTAWLVAKGRLLLFVKKLRDLYAQSNNADEYKRVSKKLAVCNHCTASSVSWTRRRGKKHLLRKWRSLPCLPFEPAAPRPVTGAVLILSYPPQVVKFLHKYLPPKPPEASIPAA